MDPKRNPEPKRNKNRSKNRSGNAGGATATRTGPRTVRGPAVKPTYLCNASTDIDLLSFETEPSRDDTAGEGDTDIDHDRFSSSSEPYLELDWRAAAAALIALILARRPPALEAGTLLTTTEVFFVTMALSSLYSGAVRR